MVHLIYKKIGAFVGWQLDLHQPMKSEPDGFQLHCCYEIKACTLPRWYEQMDFNYTVAMKSKLATTMTSVFAIIKLSSTVFVLIPQNRPISTLYIEISDLIGWFLSTEYNNCTRMFYDHTSYPWKSVLNTTLYDNFFVSLLSVYSGFLQ